MTVLHDAAAGRYIWQGRFTERHDPDKDALEGIPCPRDAFKPFPPIFCRYKGKRELVSSEEGDLSDPFRREESYLSRLYIEV